MVSFLNFSKGANLLRFWGNHTRCFDTWVVRTLYKGEACIHTAEMGEIDLFASDVCNVPWMASSRRKCDDKSVAKNPLY